jgi:hypothetical protein
LNVGILPCPPVEWKCEFALVGTCDIPNRIPVCLSKRPVVPPPKS